MHADGRPGADALPALQRPRPFGSLGAAVLPPRRTPAGFLGEHDVHRINSLGVAVLMSLAGLVMVAGCSEGEVRGANRSLQEQVSKALRLRDQALNLMEAPPVVETATGKMLPLQGVEVDPEKYENQLHSAPDGQTPNAPVQL